jgi:hypothetical protein
MRHARLLVHRLFLDGSEMRVRHGTVQLVERDPGSLDWEVVADSDRDVVMDMGRVDVEMVVVAGAERDGSVVLRDLRGAAAVVRFVGSTLVLRGDGPLEGADVAWPA